MSCTSSTYLNRLIAWYVGAEEIEQCLQTKKLSCLKGLALSALKLKFLRKGKPCERNSFVPGTRVLMAGHRTKPIEDIRTGDQVIATDPRTGRTAAKRVQATITGFGRKSLVRVTVTGPGARSSGTVTATGKHPFWAAGGRNAWRDAEQLKPGERLLTEAGAQARIDTTTTWTTFRQRVHNLTVADLHTYYVLAGDTPVLVHNSNCGNLSDPLPRGMNNKIASAYDDVKAGRIPSHDTYSGHEHPWWAGSKEYRVPGRPETGRILEKELPNGVKVYGWTSTHYTKIQRFSAPHFPDSGWNQ
ncbi:polymorphic toxin-type HINT domain-containing protein [Streptomyces sp. MS1.AVA.3]|uniref:polymorphic toxin-type HINT domain-containing protein n=1 Tax=Streptomyces decoyicus TaxID=249567 RepID=UPI0030BE7621